MKQQKILSILVIMLMITTVFGVVYNTKAYFGEELSEISVPDPDDGNDPWPKGLAWCNDENRLYSSDNTFYGLPQMGIFKVNPNNGNFERFDDSFLIGMYWYGVAWQNDAGNGNIWSITRSGNKANFHKFDLDDWPIYGTYPDDFHEKEFDCDIDDAFGLAYGDGHLWCSDESNNKIYKISPTGENIVDDFDLDDKYYLGSLNTKGLAWDNGFLWAALSDDGAVQNKIVMIQPTSGEVLSEMDVSGIPEGLAFDGENLWVIDSSDNTIKEIDIGQTEISFLIIPNDGYGSITFDGVEYNTNESVSKFRGTYSLVANIDNDCHFDRWGYEGSAIIENINLENTKLNVYPGLDATIVLYCGNYFPETPDKPESVPSGHVTGTHNIEMFNFTTKTTDPEGSNVEYGWDWNGNGIVEKWTGLYSSGEEITTSQTFDSPGTYNIQVKASDGRKPFGSGFSTSLTVEIINIVPNSPQTPVISGENDKYYTYTSYSFSTCTTDENGDKVQYGWDWNGDGNVDNILEWNLAASNPSGNTIHKSHTWLESGTYQVKVKAKDTHEDESDWSDSFTITVEDSPNNPPETPDDISGPETGWTNISYTFQTSSTDHERDELYYSFDWGDNSNPEWLGPYDSGDSCSTSHSWSTPGIYQVNVKAKDEHEAESESSNPFTITIDERENQAPNKPIIEGRTNGEANEDYDYVFSANDPEGDEIYFKIDWDFQGSTENEWLGPYNSDEEITISHSWDSEDTYLIACKAKDESGLESEWGTLAVSMPKSRRKIIKIHFIDCLNSLLILQKYPYLLFLIERLSEI